MFVKYLLSLWFLTLMLSPLMTEIYKHFIQYESSIFSILELYPMTVVISAVYSIPTLIASFLLIKLNTYFELSDLSLKLLILLVSLIGININLSLIGGSITPFLRVSYSLTLLILFLMLELVSYFVKVKKQ